MTDELLFALKEIALGRQDSGRPLAAEVARQKARAVLNAAGIGWKDARTQPHPAYKRVPKKERPRATAPRKVVPNYRTGRLEPVE